MNRHMGFGRIEGERRHRYVEAFALVGHHLIGAQHEHANVIYSSMHVHLSERDCLEAIAVKGEAQKIKKLAQELKAKRGVKQVKLSIVS